MRLQGEETPQRSGPNDDDTSTAFSDIPLEARIDFAVPVSNDWRIQKAFFPTRFPDDRRDKSVLGGMCCVFFMYETFFRCIRHDGPVGPPGIFSFKCCDAWI